jgi:hypothetical protein
MMEGGTGEARTRIKCDWDGKTKRAPSQVPGRGCFSAVYR